MHLTRFQKNFYPTIAIFLLVLIVIFYMISIDMVTRKMFYVPLVIEACLGAYIGYLVREKGKLKAASRSRKGD